MIRIEHVTRKYGPIAAVSDVSLNIERGEIVGLLGHNGAGKTTLMKMLTGYLEPTAGKITVAGIDVVTDRNDVQRQIGYMPENAPLYPEMLVQEYLLMMAELRGVAAERRQKAVGIAAGRTGLGHHMLRPIGQLSKGYRQRVGLAQAIVHEPSLLVLDEPTNGLDPMQIESIRELVRKLGEESTIILSTHILQEVEAVCDRVVVLIDGELSADAPLQELLASNVLRLVVADGDDVKAGLGGVEGIAAVQRTEDGPPGTASWAITCAPGTTPTPAVLAAAQRHGWTVQAVAPEQRTLESVFRKLQRDHIARGKEVAA
ncbi:MAG: ATP-binding cassette domain-containing protein [Myxococcota bacterium]